MLCRAIFDPAHKWIFLAETFEDPASFQCRAGRANCLPLDAGS
jgi:hypothetical protein